MTDRVKRWLDRLAAEGLVELKKRPREGVCLASWCREDWQVNKTGLCHKCHQRRWRMKSPKRSVYANLKCHAEARGIPFNLNFEYLEGMLDGVAYWDHEAESRGESLTLDRIDPTKGYVRGNLRVITLSENVAEGNRSRFLPEYVQHILERKRERAKASLGFPERDPDSCPF